MLDYNDFMIVENLEKELDTLTLNEDIFHPMKTKRIKKALKDYTKAKVDVARAEATAEQKLDKVSDPDAKEKMKKALDRKKQASQELVDRAEDALSVNATTDSLSNLAAYGKNQADIQAAKIRIKAEENDEKKAKLEDTVKKLQSKAKEEKEKIEAAVKKDKENKTEGDNKDNGEGNNNNNGSGNGGDEKKIS